MSIKTINNKEIQIWVTHSCANENVCLLEYDALQTDKRVLVFRKSLVPPSSGYVESLKT